MPPFAPKYSERGAPSLVATFSISTQAALVSLLTALSAFPLPSTVCFPEGALKDRDHDLLCSELPEPRGLRGEWLAT